MSGMSPERLAEIEARTGARRRQHEVAHVYGITLGSSHLRSAMQDADDLLAEVKRLTAENTRMRDGIVAAVAASVDSADYAELTLETLQTDLHDLLNPTEGETDADA